MMFSKAFEKTLNLVFLQAREKKHEFITVEHLLLALLDNAEAGKILAACGANIGRLRIGLGGLVDETTPHLAEQDSEEIQPTSTPSFQRVLHHAIYSAQSNGCTEVSGVSVLAAIFSEPESQAVRLLTQENIHRLDIVHCTQKKSKRSSPGLDPFKEGSSIPNSTHVNNGMPESDIEDNVIQLYAVNLNEKVSLDPGTPLIGREAELSRIMRILCRRVKHHPLLVGDPGVGKTSIIEELARCIVLGKVPDILKRCTIYSVNLGILLGGTKYRGDFEKRFVSLFAALSREPGAIVFIDEIHNLVGAGAAACVAMDASNLIKPVLTSGNLRCLGATTYDEFRSFFSKDGALMRRFQRLDIKEPSREDSIKILKKSKSLYENFHHVLYTLKSIDEIIALSEIYFPERRRPDILFDIMDEVGASCRDDTAFGSGHIITEKEITAGVAEMLHLPIESVTHSDQTVLLNLPKQLRQKVFGQDEGIDKICNAITLLRLGFNEAHKPAGSFLMIGPPGVGKTQMAIELSSSLSVPLIRFDMSEYMERHAVSRLIGSPPGYVGFEKGGLLTEAIRKQPYSVLLLDEIEKAHPDIFNILLQVMDYGQLTDNVGCKASFRHVVILMSSNAAAEHFERGQVGFGEAESLPSDHTHDLRAYFSPEFRNRLDGLIRFNHLGKTTILKIVDKFIGQLGIQLKSKGVKLKVTDTAKKWMAEHGYTKRMGARPMQRFIQSQLKLPLAHKMLLGELTSGSMAFVDCKRNQLKIDCAAHVSKEEMS